MGKHRSAEQIQRLLQEADRDLVPHRGISRAWGVRFG